VNLHGEINNYQTGGKMIELDYRGIRQSGRRYRVDDWDLKDLFRGVGRNESACRY
jgi:hypothetical protein